MEAKRKDISNFYDEYAIKQKKTGVNLRHQTILRNLKKAGLKNSSDVLEIGCGIGTETGLIAKFVTKGNILAVDISPESIAQAKANLKSYKNVGFMVTDMTDFKSDRKFDFVVLPDVLEHIPVEQHRNLFRVIRESIKPDGTVLINIPHPRILEYFHKYNPELLQIIDQPLSSAELLANAYQNDFYLESLNSYSLFYKEGDYQLVVLRPNKPLEKVTKVPKLKLVAKRIKALFS